MRCVNQIEEVCKDVEKTINQTIQNTLNSLEKDCDAIEYLVDEAINKDNQTRSANIRAYIKWCFMYLLALSLPLAIVVTMMLAMFEAKSLNIKRFHIHRRSPITKLNY